MYRRLPCDWFLSDGIHKKIRLDAPHTLEDALLEAGVLPRDASYEERQRDEWIFRRTWSYGADFFLNAEGKRVFLRLSGLRGRYGVQLNGKLLCEAEEESCTFELPPLTDPQNSIKLIFVPAGENTLRPVTGFGGAASYKLTGCAAITDLCIDGSAVRARVDAPEGEQLTLRIKLTSGEKTAEASLAGNAGGEFTFENLLDGFDAGTKIDLQAELKNGMEISDDALMSFRLPASAAARGLIGSGEELMGLGESVNADGAFLDRLSMQDVTLAARHGLCALKTEKAERLAVPAALVPGEMLLQRSGGRNDLDDPAFWLLTESDSEVYARAAAFFEEEEPDAVCAFSRYEQADRIKKACVIARSQGKPVAVPAALGSGMSVTSASLTDPDGALRPSCFALRDAWKRDFACTVSPASVSKDGIFSADIYCVSDRGGLEPASVTLTACDLYGNVVNRSSFAVTLGMGQAGRVTARIPESGVLILRTELTVNGERLSVSDEVVFKKDLKIDRIDTTQLLAANGRVTNAGNCAALGVTVPGARYFGCLLPGEYVNADSGDPDAAEGINIYI